MSEQPASDPYALLGVAVDADAATVRAAYLRLIKERHPDRRGEGEAGAGASALNAAYALLRNAERRRAYDLGRRKAAALPVVAARPRPVAPRRSRIGWWLGLPVVLGLAWVAAMLGQRAYEQTAPRIAPSMEAGGDEGLEDAPGPPSGWVDRAMVDQAVANLVALRAAGRTAEIERYSRTCSAQFDGDPNPLRADHCIAFDVAAATLRTPGKTGAPPPEVVARHAAMLRRLFAEPVATEMRVREIRAETVSAIARRLAADGSPQRDRR
ncbi:MAG TPA: J domain-containing protein [Allosphingosinicella sp.]